jgi:hypothetical protein
MSRLPREVVVIYCLLVLAVATACSTHSPATTATTPPAALTSLNGTWTVTLNGSTQNDFQATLTTEPITEFTYGLGCTLPIQAGVISPAVGSLEGCFVADSFTGQGSLSCPSCTFMPQAVLVEGQGVSPQISSMTFVIVETDPLGTLFVFLGQGSVSGDSMSGTWVCDVGWSQICEGWSGAFSATLT